MKDNHTTAAHFELFKKECRKWIEFFELSDWNIYFDHLNEPEEEYLARSTFSSVALVATLLLNKNWQHNRPNNKWVKKCARHEVIHILIGKLTVLAESRYITEDEIKPASEGLVHKIDHIIDKLEAR